MIVLAYVGLPLWKYPYNLSGTLENGGSPTLDLIPWLDGDGFMIGEHPFGQDTIGRDYFAVDAARRPTEHRDRRARPG